MSFCSSEQMLRLRFFTVQDNHRFFVLPVLHFQQVLFLRFFTVQGTTLAFCSLRQMLLRFFTVQDNHLGRCALSVVFLHCPGSSVLYFCCFFPEQTGRTKLLCLFFIVTDAFSSSEVFPVLCVYEPRSSRSSTSRELHNGALVYHEYNEYCSMKFYHSFRILRHQYHGRPRFERTNTEH